MAIDASIYQLVGRGVKSVSDYDKDAADADMARQQQQIGSLNLMLGKQKADEYTRGVQRSDALRRLSGTWGADTTDEQRIASLKNSGFAQEADSLTQTLLKQRETQSKITKEGVDAEKVKLETAHNKLSQVLNVIGSARDQPSYEQALMTLKGAGYDISSVPPQFDPAYVQNAGQQATTAQQRIEALMKQKDFDQKARNDLVGPDGTVNQPVIDAKKAIAKEGAPKVEVNTGQKGLDNEFKLRSEFKQEPIYKAHQEMQTAHGQIKQAIAQKSPAGDLAAATKIMKLLDPGSVVRESELGMAMQASGLMDRITNYGNMVLTGQKLTPQQRKDFQSLADRLMSESVTQYNSKRSEYQRLGGEYGLDAGRALGPDAKPVAPSKGGATSEGLTAAEQKELDELRARLGKKQ